MIHLTNKITGEDIFLPTPGTDSPKIDTLGHSVKRNTPMGSEEIFYDENGLEIKRKYIITVGGKKRWWQFWKKNDKNKAQDSLKEMMSRYKKLDNF